MRNLQNSDAPRPANRPERTNNFLAPPPAKNTESPKNNLLNGSSVSPTYGTNNFLPINPQKPAKISEEKPASITKNLRKKPPRMRRDNAENREDTRPWRMFR